MSWFDAKAILAGVGLALGVAGMALDARALVWAAIGVLGAAFVVRLIERRMRPAVPERDA